MTLTIPDEIVSAFPQGEEGPDRRVIESVVLQLYRDRAISAGKVAELLGIYRADADRLLARKGLTHDLSDEQIGGEKRTLDRIFGR